MVCLIPQGRIDIFDISPLFRGQAADEIFRVAAWTRSDLVVSRAACGGQVDAEKLAQRSSVAIG
jgi:hypothetical protein